jgi:tyrosyl-DNA phosphodiesterase-1
VSPLCPRLEAGGRSDGESATGFKASFLRYLRHYEVSALHQFVAAAERADMSALQVAFVASVPGSHKAAASRAWGHRAAAVALRAVSPAAAGWPVTAQASSIGSLGPSPAAWLEGELGPSLGSARVRFIYPSLQDVLQSYDGRVGGGCLPYSRLTAQKQPWLGEVGLLNSDT